MWSQSSTERLPETRPRWCWDEKVWGLPVATLRVWGRSWWPVGCRWLKICALQSSPTPSSGLDGSRRLRCWKPSLSSLKHRLSERVAGHFIRNLWRLSESLREGHWWGQTGGRAHTLISKGRKTKNTLDSRLVIRSGCHTPNPMNASGVPRMER